MNSILKTVLSLSLSGSVLILVLFFCKPLVKDKISKQWQYYIWLVVIFRLLLPFTPKISPVGVLFEQAQQAVNDMTFSADMVEDSAILPEGKGYAGGNDGFVENDFKGYDSKEDNSKKDNSKKADFLWLIWLGAALLLLVRKITIYQSFIKYIKAGREEISDISLLDILAQAGAQAGVRRPVELYMNKLISTPLLFGFFHPCIVLPAAELSDEDFQFTVLHELTHCRRWDMIYKWLLQITICVHWFNPLVYLMGREIERACELSCDEAVIEKLDEQGRRRYGDTLLSAMKMGGKYQDSAVAAMLNAFTFHKGTLNRSSELLKERLNAIMCFKKSSKIAKILSGVFTVMLVTGATTIGAYAGNTGQNRDTSKDVFKDASNDTSNDVSNDVSIVSLASEDGEEEKVQNIRNHGNDTYSSMAEKYYENGSISLLAASFAQLDADAGKKLLNKIYMDRDIAAFSACLTQLPGDSPLMQYFAEKAYADDIVSFFSVLANYMDEETLEFWREKAVQERKISFQSVLSGITGKTAELEKMEAELEARILEEYREYGITKEGAMYYYKGQSVSVLLDVHADGSFVELNMNPLGQAAIRITRNQEDKIEHVGYMTEEEVAELFMGDDMESDIEEDGREPDVSTGADRAHDKTVEKEDVDKELNEPDASADAGKQLDRPNEIVDADKEDAISRLTQNELSDYVKKALNNCSVKTWYIIRGENRQYIYYNDSAWEYAYAPKWQDGEWQVEIVRLKKSPLKKTSSGYLLLSVPKDEPVRVSCDGEMVTLTEMEL